MLNKRCICWYKNPNIIKMQSKKIKIIKHANFSNCGSTIPRTCVGSERFLYIFITRIFKFSKQFLSEFGNAALTTRQSHCRFSGVVLMIRSKCDMCRWIRVGADKSLARPTSLCRRTESIVSLERGVCSCGELLGFSCYRGWKGTCQATRAISTTSRRELSSGSTPPPVQGKTPKEIHALLKEMLGEHAPSYATIKNWVTQFKRGDFSTCGAPRPGRPKTVTTPETIDQIRELILEDRRISAKSITEQLGISRERVRSIIHEDLDMQKLSAIGVPKCLNADQTRQRCRSSEQIWNFFGAIQIFSCRNYWPWMKPGYITITRRQSNNQWSGGIGAHPTPKN